MSTHGPLARRHPMPTPIAPRIILAHNTRLVLHTLARAHTTPQSLALRARIVLRAAAVDQPTNLHIGRELGCSHLTVHIPRMSATQSMGRLPLSPREACHPIHGNAATQST